MRDAYTHVSQQPLPSPSVRARCGYAVEGADEDEYERETQHRHTVLYDMLNVEMMTIEMERQNTLASSYDYALRPSPHTSKTSLHGELTVTMQ